VADSSSARAAELGATGAPVIALTGGQPPGLEVCVTCPEAAPFPGEQLLMALREASSRPRVRELGRDTGYRIEDAVAVALAAPTAEDASRWQAWLARRVGGPIAAHTRAGPFALAAVFVGRVGHAPTRPRYALASDGRVRVEAFELHVAEHCNLRCANCCNMSPLVGERTLSVAEVAAFTTRMATALHADVVKIMGGEPLLHPDLPGVLRVLRASGIADRVRLFTNGLLLAAQPDAFWEALDELTISSYTSAPVKPATLELARSRARRHDFVLNIKPVDEFAQVLSPRYQADDARTATTYARCWLRHRCLVVRDRRFYMCTRAAYASEFLATVAHEPATAPLDRSGDGISIDEPDLAGALATYMNRDQPLGACRYCFGGDGATEAHYQLSRAEVAAGVLSRKLAIVR
jgi:organic radical activating enzyme